MTMIPSARLIVDGIGESLSGINDDDSQPLAKRGYDAGKLIRDK